MAEGDPTQTEKDKVVAFFTSKKVLESPFGNLLQQLARMQDEHRLLVIVTHAYVELMVNTLIESRCKNGKKIKEQKRDFTHATKLTILNEAGILSDHHYELLNWFRKLRNDAAHEPFFTLTRQRLDIMASKEYQDPKGFWSLCLVLVGDLWLTYRYELGVIYFPHVYEGFPKDARTELRPPKSYRIPLKTDPKTVK